MSARIKTEAGSYRFTIRRLEQHERGGWLITFPDVPGCVSDGKTIGAAIAHGRQALLDLLPFRARRQNPEPVRKRRAAR